MVLAIHYCVITFSLLLRGWKISYPSKLHVLYSDEYEPDIQESSTQRNFNFASKKF